MTQTLTVVSRIVGVANGEDMIRDSVGVDSCPRGDGGGIVAGADMDAYLLASGEDGH